MTPQLLLEKIIEKAVKGGYCPKGLLGKVKRIYLNDERGCIFFGEDGNGEYFEVTYIYLHDSSFAKAFFGEKYICISCNKESGLDFFEHERLTDCDADYEAWYTLPAWREHIQQLALTPPEERLSYLGKWL